MPQDTLPLSPASPALADVPERQPTLVLHATSGWSAINFREMWQYRDLLLILIERDVKLRYKQTAIGILWVVIQPLLAAGIFSVIFGLFAKLPSGGIPYLLFNFSALVGWNYFSGALQRASGSLISNSQLISKVYFPRLIIPFAHTLAVLIDFAVMFGLLLVLMAFYHWWPTWRILTLPFFLALGTMCAAGMSLWLSAMSVRFRDFMYALPFMIQVWMYASPVVYSMTLIPAKWRALYEINPLVGFIEGVQWSTVGGSALNGPMLILSIVISSAIFIGGCFFFRRVERSFADVI